MDVSPKDCDPDRVLGAYGLQPLHKGVPLLLVRSGGIMIVQVVKQVNASVKSVEHAPAEPEPSVQQLNWTDQRTGEDILEPCKALYLG